MRKAGAAALMMIVVGTSPDASGSDRVRAYEIRNGREIPNSLIGVAGDWELGRRVYFNRTLAGCSGCHGSPGGPGAQPDVGVEPASSLAGIADRLPEGLIRTWLIAPELIAAERSGHSYYRVGQRDDPLDPRFGETRLSATEIEGLIAYLLRQKGN
ncbi:MAG: c-type cytochrome [Pseudomonadota bacterium]